MKINELTSFVNGKILSHKENDREVTGAYICDLLSFAIAKIKENDAWVTIQAHVNVVAVAQLTDAACVIVAEDVEVTDEVIKVAQEKGVTLISSPFDAFKISVEIGKLL